MESVSLVTYRRNIVFGHNTEEIGILKVCYFCLGGGVCPSLFSNALKYRENGVSDPEAHPSYVTVTRVCHSVLFYSLLSSLVCLQLSRLYQVDTLH